MITLYLGTARIEHQGVVYDRYLRKTGQLKQSITRAVDRCDITVENVSSLLGADWINRVDEIHGAAILVKRLYRDIDNGQTHVLQVMTGYVRSAKADQSAVILSAIPDTYQKSIGGGRRVARKCQWRFRDLETCGYSGAELTCNKLLNSAGGCSGRSNQHRFGGFVYMQPKDTVSGASGTPPPAANQLIQSDAASFQQRTFLKFTGGGVTDDAVNNRTVVSTGGHALENNNVAVTSRTQVNIPPYHPLKFEDDAGGTQTLLKGSGLEIAIRNLVIDYGADPLGVVAADTAFANAIAGGAKLSIPAGTYRVTSAVTLALVNESTGFIMEGQGKTSVILFEGSGHCFVAPNGASGYWTMRDFRLVCTNLSNTGDGIRLIANSSSVNTRCLLDGVSVWNFGGGSGGWGFNADNLQSSVIRNCHFRGNISGHIRLVDPDDVDPVKEPNANVIADNLLDNSPADDFNVAAIYLFNANGTKISGNTIQGNFSGSTGNLHAIYAEHCDGLAIGAGLTWVEDLCLGGSAVKLKNCRAVTVNNYHGSGAYAWDFEMENVRSIDFSGLTLLNSVPHFVTDSACRGISVRASVFDHPENIIQSDSIDRIYVYADCHYHGNTNTNYREYIGTNARFTGWGEQHLVNPHLIDDENGWTKNATYVSRVATGGPQGLGGYWLFDPGGSDGGAILSDILYQSVSIDDSVQPGWWTFSWDTYIVDDGNADDADRHVGIAVFATGTTEFTTIIDNQVDNVYPVAKWFPQCISVYLPAGSSRILRWRLDPAQTTRGPKTPKVRFGNFRLAPGREAQPGGFTMVAEERTNILRGPNGLQFAARPSAAAPPSGYGGFRWTGTDYEVYKSGAWTALSTGAGSGANTALSNLASVAINTALLPGTDNSIDLGSGSFRWQDIFAINAVLSGDLSVGDDLTVTDDVAIGGDMTIDATGSSTGTPREVGMINMGSGTAVRIKFGDNFNALQNSNAGRMVLQCFHSMRFHGLTYGQASETPVGFSAGSTSDPNHEFFGSDGGFGETIEDNTVVQIRGAPSMPSGSGSFFKCVLDDGTERFEILEDGDVQIQNVQVLTSRRTGWGAPTGTATRSSFATGSVTLSELAERVKGLIDDLTTHGVIGS